MTGQQLVDIAETRKGCDYVLGEQVPKNDPDYKGAFDCAEFVSWAVYQLIKKLYGCENNASTDPKHADAGTVYWARDVRKEIVRPVTIEVARATPGAILLREAADGGTGHIVISKGDGTTIEAMGTKWGVTNGKVDLRRWTCGILLNELEYASNEMTAQHPVEVLHVGGNNNSVEVVALQAALINKGYDLANPDGIYGPKTAEAVRAFQVKRGLTPDGEAGVQTKKALGL